MCHHCDSPSGPRVGVTDDNVGQMLHETTTVAVNAAAIYGNGWFNGARGLYADMTEKWGHAANLRMTYVWGAARFFLPAPPGMPVINLGYDRTVEQIRGMTGRDEENAGHLVALGDQVQAAMEEVTQAASKGAIQRLSEVIVGFDSEEMAQGVAMALLGEAGLRMRHAHETKDDRARDLFDAHVAADLPRPVDDDEAEPGDATA